MKKNLKNIALLIIASVTAASCSTENSTTETPNYVPSAQAFAALQNAALSSVTQNYVLTAENGITTFNSPKGVTIKINGGSLRKNGNPVTGSVDVKYIEVFDTGKMLTTDKTTMGLQANGQMSLIISGGEFFIEAKQAGVLLTTVSPIELVIPGALTGGINTAMRLWTGQLPAPQANMLGWIANDPGATGNGGVFANGQGTISGGTYSASLPGFGWTWCRSGGYIASGRSGTWR